MTEQIRIFSSTSTCNPMGSTLANHQWFITGRKHLLISNDYIFFSKVATVTSDDQNRHFDNIQMLNSSERSKTNLSIQNMGARIFLQDQLEVKLINDNRSNSLKLPLLSGVHFSNTEPLAGNFVRPPRLHR